MISPEYCQVMARYNRWMNERLYALVAEITDVERWMPGVVRIVDAA